MTPCVPSVWDKQPVKEPLCGTSVWPLVFPHIVGQTASEGSVRNFSMVPCIPSHCGINSQWRSWKEHQYGPLYSFTLWDKQPVELLCGNITMASYRLQALLGMRMLLQRMFHHHHVNLSEMVLGRHLQTFQSWNSCDSKQCGWGRARIWMALCVLVASQCVTNLKKRDWRNDCLTPWMLPPSPFSSKYVDREIYIHLRHHFAVLM